MPNFPWLELGANALNAISILLAARNSMHTWWLGIAGCALFAVLFHEAKLYADALLQIFFIGTSAFGWRLWSQRIDHKTLRVTRTTQAQLLRSIAATIIVAIAYGWMLHQTTDAYAPFVDSLVLAFSVLAQLLLMRRSYETWWIWIFVNTLAVALFASRHLWITAALYAAFWINAVIASVRWRRLIVRA